MVTLISIAIISILLTPGVYGQTVSDTDELTRLLIEFLDGASRNDASVHDRFWADDLIYTGSGGRRVGKAEIMHDVRSAPEPKQGDPVITYTAEDIRIQQYGETAIVAFRLVAAMQTGEVTEFMHYFNTGTFLKREGIWQAVSWQATRIPDDEGEG